MGIDAETYAAAKAYVDHEIEGGGGTLDYEALRNHPSINGNELVGNKSSKQLGIQNLFTGTTTEWAQLTADQKAQYTHVCFTDDTAQEVIVVANPEAQATAELTKLQVGQSVYSVPSGAQVADNTGAIEAIVNEYGAKNLFNPNTFVNGLLDHDTGGVLSDGYWITSDYVEISGTIIIQGWKDGSEDNYCVRFCEYDANKTFIKDTMNINLSSDAHYSRTITLDSNTRYIKASFGFNSAITTPSAFFATNRAMIQDARITDPTYVPYAMTNRELTERIVIKSVTGHPDANGYVGLDMPTSVFPFVVAVPFGGVYGSTYDLYTWHSSSYGWFVTVYLKGTNTLVTDASATVECIVLGVKY